MHHAAQLLAFSAVALMGSSSASPLQARQSPVKCDDVTTGLAPTCWAALDMTEWLANWAKTTPGVVVSAPAPQAAPASPSSFGSGGDDNFRRAAAGCELNEAWSTCFSRLALGHTGQDCTKLSTQSCTAPQADQPPKTPQIFYGVYSIYGESFRAWSLSKFYHGMVHSNTLKAINEYLTSLYSALQMLLTVKPDAIRTAATTSPDGTPKPFPAAKPYSVDSVLVQILSKQTKNQSVPAATNAPLIGYLDRYPSATTYDQNTPVDELVRGMQQSLVDALGVVMGDIGVFAGFAEEGAFSTGELPKLYDLVGAFAA